MMSIHKWISELNMSTFSERLKMLREARNITQVRLAELLDIDPRVYNRWERGSNTPQLDALIKVADILQVSIDEIVGRKEPSFDLKIRNHELHRLCQESDSLPDEDQQALIQVMDGLLKKAQLTKLANNKL